MFSACNIKLRVTWGQGYYIEYNTNIVRLYRGLSRTPQAMHSHIPLCKHCYDLYTSVLTGDTQADSEERFDKLIVIRPVSFVFVSSELISDTTAAVI